MHRLGRPTRMTTLLALISFTVACAVRGWQPTPASPTSASREAVPGKRLRAEMASGRVVMRVAHLEYPFVEGVAEPGPGEVTFDLRRSLAAEVRALRADGTALRGSVPDVSTAQDLVGRDVQFETAEGSVALRVRAHDGRVVRGRPLGCWGEQARRCTGLVSIDLRETKAIGAVRTSGLVKVLAVTLLAYMALWIGCSLDPEGCRIDM